MINHYIYLTITTMKNTAELPWIEAGYELFSHQGPDGLKIEQIARKVGISKSSFYHHFADLSIFQEKLLVYHLDYAKAVAEKASHCESLIPDFLHLMVEVKPYILFNRQLRIHRENVSFQLCFERAVTVVEDELLDLWSEMLDLKEEPRIAANILKVSIDLFYHRVTDSNLTYEWLIEFIEEIKIFLKDVIRSSGLSSQMK
jgi:AcrR family transcriptional regulator